MIVTRQVDRLLGVVDLLRHRVRLREHFAGPFNGQRKRIAIIEAILRKHDFGCAVETGTHRGTTTKYLSDRLPLVVSIESELRYLTFARLRLRGRRNVTIVEGDSGREIEGVLGKLQARRSVFAYLDAHWGAHLPLGEELRALERSGLDYVAVIDDFSVPGDAGYGFDSYADGAIGGRYVFASVPRLTRLWVPSAPSEVETGRMRGTGFVASAGLEPLLVELEEAGMLTSVPRDG